MANSKVWASLSPEEKKIKRREYNARYKAKHPEKVKEQNALYKEKNKEVLREKATVWQKKKSRENKIKAIEYKGGKCLDCQGVFHPCCYDFHHTDPTVKDTTIARIMGRDFENIKEELDKCVLLCAHCHRIRHYNENEDPS